MRLLAIPIPISFLVLTATATATAGAGVAAAQEQTTPPGWSLYPSASVGMVYDDNLFFRRGRTEPGEGIVYTRFGLNLDATHRGRTSTFRGGYGLRGEYFTGDDEDFTQIPSDHRAFVNVSSSIGQRNTLATTVSYSLSYDPNQVFEDVGVELGRRRSEGYSANVQFSRQLTPKNSLGVNYGLGYRELDAPSDVPIDELARESVSHQAGLSWTHTLGERASGTFQYSYRLFENEQTQILVPELDSPFQSHAATYGWSFRLGPRTSLSAFGGPLFYQDLDQESLELVKIWRITPQVSLSFERGWEHTSLTLSYGRSQSQFVGTTGSLITDQAGASFGVTPHRRVSFDFSTGASRNSRAGQVFETYRAGVSGRLEITPWWSLDGNYGFTSQDRGFLFADDAELDRINRNTAYIGITIGKTVPLE